ncbi:MAG: hypothetical protein LC808_09085 [Actinobacteria bacterium]|nr:hypothetical protein [Actinomycetota bacterium]
MIRTHARRFFVLLALVVALCAAIAAAPAGAAPEREPQSPAEAAAVPVLSLSSCKDIRTLFPVAPDGVYPVLAGPAAPS